MHIHPWTYPLEESDCVINVRDTYLHNSSREVITKKLKKCLGDLNAAGIHPTSFRGGRYSSGSVVQEFLCANGLSLIARLCHTQYGKTMVLLITLTEARFQ